MQNNSFLFKNYTTALNYQTEKKLQKSKMISSSTHCNAGITTIIYDMKF